MSMGMDEKSEQTYTQSIILIGLMGSGKTTIGKEISRATGLPFLDMDSVIEEQVGMSISEIFRTKGEAHFRALETALLHYMEKAFLRDHKIHVISTGGGVVLREENRSILRRLGFTVWLNVDLPTLLQRTARSHGRPLLAENDREATLHRLIDERYPLYAETCHISIPSSQLQPQQVADFIIARSAQFAKSLQ